MEERLKALLDMLTEEEAKELLNPDENNISLDIDKKTMERIKRMTFRKAGIAQVDKTRRTVPLTRRLTAVAAILILVVGILSAIGFENVSAAINRFFRFIPGYAIVTEEDFVTYAALERDVTVENDTHRMTLKTAVATSNTVTVSIDVVYKEFKNPGVGISKQEILDKLEGTSHMPGLYLCHGNERIQVSHSQRSGGGTDYYRELITGTFYLDKKQITDGSVFELSYDDIGLSMELRFKSYESFSELSAIGPTEVHNDIAITAIPSYDNGVLTVELYPVNKSEYEIHGLINEIWKETPVADENLHLETEDGEVAYRLPEGPYSGYYRHFYFDIPDPQGEIKLKIPYIIVKASEKAEKTISIPEIGESKSVDIPFKFSDGIMRLTEVERIKAKEEQFGKEADGVKLTFMLESNRDNMKLFVATPDKWKHISSAYRWEYDKDRNRAILWYYPDRIRTGRYKLSLDEPLYILTDPYVIDLSSDILSGAN